MLLRFPETWGDFQINDRDDYSEAHRPIFEHIALQLNATPPGSVDPLLLSEHMRRSGKTQLLGGFDPYEYISGLTNRYVEKQQAAHHSRELKRLRVRREQITRLEGAKQELIASPNITFDEMGSLVEKALTSITTAYHKPEVMDLFESLEANVEARAENPINPDEQLYQGPLPSINRTIGPLIFPGSVTTTIARTSTGKSAFSFYYCIHVAERYNLPLLWLDAGEMTMEQLQMRAVSCLSGGKVPLWMVRTGEWRKHVAMVKLVRALWPRVRKLRMFYHNTGGMAPKEKIAFVRRFHFNKVGRDEFLIVCEDYLKGVEALGKDRAEYQAVGYYVSEMKNLVTDEINAGYWSSLQSNRSGITKGKKVNEMQVHEGSASLSDRISWECTNQFFMRLKEPSELALEHNLFGNIALHPTKVREGYGREYERVLRPVKLANGEFMTNYFHMAMTQFAYEDRGLHSEVLASLGQAAVDVSGEAKPSTAVL